MHTCTVTHTQINDPSISFGSAIISILLNQSCPKVMVGNPHQQIYSFKGACNTFTSVLATGTYCLSEVSTWSISAGEAHVSSMVLTGPYTPFPQPYGNVYSKYTNTHSEWFSPYLSRRHHPPTHTSTHTHTHTLTHTHPLIFHIWL